MSSIESYDIYTNLFRTENLEPLPSEVPQTRSAQKERIRILTDQNNKLRFLVMGLMLGNNKEEK